MTHRTPPIPNSYWVTDHLLAGEYPGSYDEDETRERLTRLLDAGIRIFVNLTEDHELPPYDGILDEEAAARNIDVEHVRLSIRDRGVAPVRRMEEILEQLDRTAREGRPAYVHCWGGVGRTGTVVGCHLVANGRTGDDALREVARLFATMSPAKVKWHPESPETEEQRAMVRDWASRSLSSRQTPRSATGD